jgi:hypothetical protein
MAAAYCIGTGALQGEPAGIRFNKFDEFYRNSLKFDGFGLHRISKSTILLFIDSKYVKNKNM